jgi:hypothetical protein
MMDIDQVSEMHLVSLKKILVYSFTVKAWYIILMFYFQHLLLLKLIWSSLITFISIWLYVVGKCVVMSQMMTEFWLRRWATFGCMGWHILLWIAAFPPSYYPANVSYLSIPWGERAPIKPTNKCNHTLWLWCLIRHDTMSHFIVGNLQFVPYLGTVERPFNFTLTGEHICWFIRHNIAF